MSVRDAIRSALKLLDRRDRRLLTLSIALQSATAILDLVGIILIGLVGALAVTSVQSQPPPMSVERVADGLGMGSMSDQTLVAVFAGTAAIVLLTKSIVSSFLTRRVLRFLANRQALVSARLVKELLSRPLAFLQSRTSQETAFALISGANAATVQLLGQLVVAVSEVALLALLAVALLFLSPLVSVGAIAFFALVAYALQRAVGGWASRSGEQSAKADIMSYAAVQEVMGVYREISVSNRRTLYVDRIQLLRWQAARTSADMQFLGMFPKYMFEIALVVGGFALAAALFTTQDSVAAVGTLALFLAAASRVMPSLLRLQGATLGMRTAAGLAEPTLKLAADLGHPTEASIEPTAALMIRERIRQGFQDFQPSVSLEGVSVTYPEAPQPALSEICLSIDAGASVALVGRSGAGKSTLADVILGLLTPDCGRVMIGGQSPADCVAKWPGSMAYVPQDIALANGTVRANVALGLPDEAIDDDWVWDALRRAHLDTYLSTKRDGLHTVVGENGLKLSGGQRQRLGIARALYARPRLIIFDEATSALDAETEQAVTSTLRELDGEVTRVLIAHRLSTVRGVDQVVYLESGRIAATGTFLDVVQKVPSFERQAHLMGLAD